MAGSGAVRSERTLLAAQSPPSARRGSTDSAGSTMFTKGTRATAGRQKRTLIESACSACRRRKSRILETERTELRELISYLQTRPEPEAQEVFQRIRSGGPDDIFALLRQLREGNESHSMQDIQTQRPQAARTQEPSHSPPPSNQRLPPISTMFEVSGSYTRPPLTLPMMQSVSGPQGPSSARSHSSRSQSSQSGASDTSSLDYPFRNGF
ncbi:hypothetical protein LTR82_011437 [Friedmanniomyces endolithicus]|uniref:Uncharacterized protein n=1 Tax=Friedmanniomyces endolithicus TaxID=329885 RepID=A0AAN6FFX3_9PEZI|nr:hypothetical protein LTR82_011437 [Friedmanniomyces endolithicus]